MKTEAEQQYSNGQTFLLQYRGRYLALCLGGLVFMVLLGCMGLFIDKGVGSLLFAALFYGFALFIAFDIYTANIRKQNRIEVSDYGIDYRSAFQRKRIAWHDIQGLFEYKANHVRFLGVLTKKDQVATRSLLTFYSHLFGGQFKMRIPLYLLAPEDVSKIVVAFERNQVVDSPVDGEEVSPVVDAESRSDSAFLYAMVGSTVVFIGLNELLILLLHASFMLLGSIFLLFAGWYFIQKRSKSGTSMKNKAILASGLFLYALGAEIVHLAVYNYSERGLRPTLDSFISLFEVLYDSVVKFDKDGLVTLVCLIGVPVFVFYMFHEKKKPNDEHRPST